MSNIEYWGHVPSNTAALPRTRPAPVDSASTFGSCDWSQGSQVTNGVVCPTGWTFNPYSLQCESGYKTCAPPAFADK
jgi:hypothetical protein